MLSTLEQKKKKSEGGRERKNDMDEERISICMIARGSKGRIELGGLSE